MIYAIRAVGSGFTKIGKAASVGKRLKELETGCPHELNIEAVANWPDIEERRIHKFLLPDHERGEWFKDGALVDEIIELFRAGMDGLIKWQVKCHFEQMEIRQQEKLNRLLSRRRAEQKRKEQVSQPLLHKPLVKPLMTPSQDMEMAIQFMQSLMNWELSTLRSIDISLSTENQIGVMQR